MELGWLKNFPLSSYVPSFQENFVNLDSPWSILAASVGGLAVSGFVGHYYLKYRERLDENANEKLALTNVVGHVWTSSYQFQMSLPPIAIQSNMFVIRLRSGKLLVYNPIDLNTVPLLKKQLEAIGEVGLIVIPNLGHLKFFPQFVELYPAAKLIIPPDSLEVVIKRLKSAKAALPYNGIIELRKDKLPEGLWDDEIEHTVFGGVPWLNEIILFHEPSKMLITCDTAFNLRDGILKMKDPSYKPLCLKYGSVFGVYNQLGVSSNYRLFIRDKAAVRDTLDRLSKWNFKGIGMAHGVPIAPNDSDVKSQLQKAWEQLL
jgi:hypothetical protein